MAFLAEVKAKLGLDISPFERGIKQAQTSAGGLAKGIGKQFASTEKVAGALAAAIGLNMQSIADSIARFVTGFSKEAEAELNEIVATSAAAANKQEAALEALKQKRLNLLDEVTKAEKDAAFERLSLEEQENKLIAERDSIRGAAVGDSLKALEARKRMLEIEKQLSEIFDKKIAKEQAALEKRRDAMEAEKKAAEEQAKMEEEVFNFFEDIRLNAEKKRTDELKKQLEVLEDQKDTVKSTLADYAASQRRSIQATTGEVRSGERNIGSRARKEVSELDKSQARVRKLEDAEQRKREELDAAKSEGDRRRIIEEGRKLKTEKETELGRSEKLKRGLEGRVSDIDTNKASLDKLTNIDKGIKELNEKLTSTSI